LVRGYRALLWFTTTFRQRGKCLNYFSHSFPRQPVAFLQFSVQAPFPPSLASFPNRWIAVSYKVSLAALFFFTPTALIEPLQPVPGQPFPVAVVLFCGLLKTHVIFVSSMAQLLAGIAFDLVFLFSNCVMELPFLTRVFSPLISLAMVADLPYCPYAPPGGLLFFPLVPFERLNLPPTVISFSRRPCPPYFKKGPLVAASGLPPPLKFSVLF